VLEKAYIVPRNGNAYHSRRAFGTDPAQTQESNSMMRVKLILAAMVVFQLATDGVIADPVEQAAIVANGTAALPQQAPSPITTAETPQSAKEALLQQKLGELNRLQREIEQLRTEIGIAQQILVKVQVLEVSRTKLRRLGVDIAYVMDAVASDAKNRPNDFSMIGDRPGFRVFDRSDAFLRTISALRGANVAKVLADPSIVVVSGRPASFNVGSELPIPSPPGTNKGLQFQTFGTKVNLLATDLGHQKTRLELLIRVAEPDYSHNVEIDGHRVPAMNLRQVDTAVELKSGQTALLNGLVQVRNEAIEHESGTTEEKEEIETWFIVTPEFMPSIANAPASMR
jgi:Flp pilus assembly secretin CpaC